MNGTMSGVLAQASGADLESGELYRAADRGGGSLIRLAPEPAARVELRSAGGAADGVAVARLAVLDEAPALNGRVLLALLDGHAVAAVSLEDGRVVANPFVPTANAVAMLRLRAEQLVGPPRHRRRAWFDR